MPASDVLAIWAVHISDGILTAPWLVGGFIIAGCLALGAVVIDLVLARFAARPFREEEIAQTAVLTAAFFVASLIHVPLRPTSVHLLLNGLIGVVLGWRAALAIPVGLFLQAALIGHGGFSVLGVNSCIMVIPALLAWLLFAGLRRLPGICSPWFRSSLVAVSCLAWTLSLVYSLALLFTNKLSQQPVLETAAANRLTFHPLTLAAAVVLTGLAVWVERRLENRPEFPLGLLVGEITVLATAALNFLVLLYGGQEDWHTLALVTFVAHLPIAVVEGIIMGFAVGFLARVKPDMLGWVPLEEVKCVTDSLP
jgi:cobalt/nickel transport system permease protein